MKSTNDIKLALRDATTAVNKLFRLGYDVIDISMTNRRPILTIDSPLLTMEKKATKVSCQHPQRNAHCLYVVPYEGCLVTWKAQNTNNDPELL